MSHRVTTESEMKEVEILAAVCKQQGVSYTQSGTIVTFTNGAMNKSTLNLVTGQIQGDTDHGHTVKALGKIRQAYAEEKYRRECAKQGISILSREVVGEDVRLQIASYG